MSFSMQHVASPGTLMRRRRMNDLFYPPRTHCDDELRLPKYKPVATTAAKTLLGHRHRVSDVFTRQELSHGRRPLRETETPLRTLQQRMSELLYRSPSSAGGDSQKSDASIARKPASDAKPQRRVSQLFYRPPTSTRGDSQKSDASAAHESAPDTKPKRRMIELFCRPPSRTQSESEMRRAWPTKSKGRMSEMFVKPPTRIQSKSPKSREWPPSLARSVSLPLNDSGLATSGTQNACHDGGCSRTRQAEQKDLTERLERLNLLSAVIERKLQEQKERKLLRLIYLLTSEAMHGDEMI